MPVNFTGGPSGMRSGDFFGPGPAKVHAQPVLNTATNTDSESGVYFASDDIQRKNHYTLTADFMPKCCSPHPEDSTDVQQQDISGL